MNVGVSSEMVLPSVGPRSIVVSATAKAFAASRRLNKTATSSAPRRLLPRKNLVGLVNYSSPPHRELTHLLTTASRFKHPFQHSTALLGEGVALSS